MCVCVCVCVGGGGGGGGGGCIVPLCVWMMCPTSFSIAEKISCTAGSSSLLWDMSTTLQQRESVSIPVRSLTPILQFRNETLAWCTLGELASFTVLYVCCLHSDLGTLE